MSDDTQMLAGTDPFGAPAPRAVRGKGKGSEYIDPAGIRRDRWDRPLLPHPHTGVVQPWTSVTTLAGTLADRYALGQWQQRTVALGMGLRHDLAAMAASLVTADPDSAKTQLQSIATDAMEAAGASVGRNMGNALHDLTDEFDRTADHGRRVDMVRRLAPSVANDLKAYAQTMEALGLQVRPDHIERMTVCLATQSAGTFDRLVLCPDGMYRIADLKTGQHADTYGYYELAQQLAQYANGEAVWRVTNQATGEGVWEDLQPAESMTIDRTMGLLIWLPAGGIDGVAHCEVRPVDLVNGLAAAQRSVFVRAERKASKAWVAAPLVPTGQPAPEPTIPGRLYADGMPEGYGQPPGNGEPLTTPPATGTAALASVREEYVELGYCGCVNCLAPDEDPAPWCDCRWDFDGLTDHDGPCKRKAHPVAECPVLAQRGRPSAQAATEALDSLLLQRIAGADLTALGGLAANPPPGWTDAHTAAAADRWTVLSAQVR
jgi:hypothetical protein